MSVANVTDKVDLQGISAGFEHQAYGSQSVFRVALDALSHPGRPLTVPIDTELPRAGYPASAALLLALLDSDTCVWVSPVLAQSDAAKWLRFHTGCQVVTDPSAAQFLWIEQSDAMPTINTLALGSEEYPETSATCVIEVQKFDAQEQGLVLQGPGIPNRRFLGITGLPKNFELQWAQNHALFPQGIDALLATKTQVVGLPRSTAALATSGLPRGEK
jgi:alpha-D-ribose 1-methylphosphonate 5-triphosphate synthase subunit PhnH